MTHLKTRFQAAWLFTAHSFSVYLPVPSIPPIVITHITWILIRHQLSVYSHQIFQWYAFFPKWKTDIRWTMRILFPFNSGQYLSYMYKPIVSLKESRGFHLPLVALRCQVEGVEIDHCLILSARWISFTYQRPCERVCSLSYREPKRT